jgi:hypothetical protein
MAFSPYSTPKYNIADPYGTSPSQRLSQALAGSAMQSKGAQRQYGGTKFDLAKTYKKRVPQIVGQFSRRGLETSGMKNLALAEAASSYDRQRSEQRSALDQALFNIALQRMGDYGAYAGSRFEDTLGATESRAQRAAQIREALA